MPRVSVDERVEIHYEERGSGPLVVIASYWSMHPSALEPLTAALEADHRVVRYDDRGTGESTRTGPYDLDTAASDLAALLQALGEPAVIVGVADGPARAVRVADTHPELVAGIVCPGGVPIGRANFDDADALATSESVITALLQQIETDYRGALRALIGPTNEQMTEDEMRERVIRQAEHVPVEAGAARLRAWAADDPIQLARAAGDKLFVLVTDGITGNWFPTGAELAAVVANRLPEARVEQISDGWVSAPGDTAAVVRRITAAAAHRVS
ncbi:MAG: alpha/beta fold hydrolase [Solirubrobacterales bacterium]